MVGVSCQFFSNITPDDFSLRFNPANLPDAQNGVPYPVEISVENVKTFVGLFSVIAGKLPPGLSLERVPGENMVKIIGTPTEDGTFAFTLEAACEGTNTPGQVGDHLYQIIVLDVVDDSSLKFNPADLPDAQNGVPYQVEISVENVITFVGQFSVMEGKLPPGLSLERVPNENTVKIIGTPTETGTFVFTLEAICDATNDPGQVGDHIYQIIVK
jgi:ribosomal protein L6P/L9E